MKISLLPGWGLGLAPLQPLVDNLSGYSHAMLVRRGLPLRKGAAFVGGKPPPTISGHCTKGLAPEKSWGSCRGQAPSYKKLLSNKYEVQLLPLPECTTVEQALDELDAQVPDGSWLIGWSLGGMLATALAHRRGSGCLGLVTLASNACFVARDDWPRAMPQREFNSFSRRVARDWAGTLKGFQQLCLHGGQLETVPAELSATASTNAEARVASLSWLAQLDNRTAIAELQCRQLHVLADFDALVPASVGQDLQQLNPQVQIRSWPGSHAFVLEDHSELAATVHAFMTWDVTND